MDWHLIIRRRARGLWIGRFAEPEPALHTERASRNTRRARTAAGYKWPVQAAKVRAGEPIGSRTGGNPPYRVLAGVEEP